MAKSKNHITNLEEYQRYLRGDMSPKERHNFEKRLLDDDFESEAFEGISQLDADDFATDFNALKNELNDRVKKKSTISLWRMAAAILLLGIFSFITYYLIDTNASRDIARSKNSPLEEKSDTSTSKAILGEDSSSTEPDRIIALQQDVSKEKPEEAPAKIDRRKPVMESEKAGEGIIKGIEGKKEPALILEKKSAVGQQREESLEDEVDIATLKVIEDTDINMQAQQPDQLPEIDYARQLEVPMAPERAKRRKQAGLHESATPSAVMNQAKPIAIIYGEQRTISGKVFSDEDDNAIPGASVTMNGTSITTATDLDGNFSIDIPKNRNVTLVFSSIGYAPKEIMVNKQDSLLVNLEPDINSASEIVVIGNGTADEAAETSYISPRPEGGHAVFKDYIKDNIRYPVSALDKRMSGTVHLKFSVQSDGELSNMQVLKSMGEDFDQEAMRLITEGPKWMPAKENNSLVPKDVKVSIRFQPPN